MARVTIRKGKARLFKEGNPLVYGGAVSSVFGDPQPGDAVDVVDNTGKFMGWGVFNPFSMYRVRILALDGNKCAKSRDMEQVLESSVFSLLARNGEILCDLNFQFSVQKMTRAVASRAAVGIPSKETDAYRLINGEGDLLSGLIIDVYGDVAVVSSVALWVEVHRETVTNVVRRVLGAARGEGGEESVEVVWRRNDGWLQQDGWKSEKVLAKEAALAKAEKGGDEEEEEVEEDFYKGVEVDNFEHNFYDDEDKEDKGKEDEERKEGKEEVTNEESAADVVAEVVEEAAETAAPVPVVNNKPYVPDETPPFPIHELGLEYLVQPRFGQKTGFYCDQRDNRELVRSLSAGKRVLDVCCFSGGFSLNAAKGGATEVVAVDSSTAALEAGELNAERNGLSDKITWVKADALKYLQEAAGTQADKFDIVCLDPPKLAPNKKALPKATIRYRRLNAGALEAVKPGGMLLTFTCSAAMTREGDFVRMVQEAAQQVGRSVTLLKQVGAASDHVISPAYRDGTYLSGALFFVE